MTAAIALMPALLPPLPLHASASSRAATSSASSMEVDNAYSETALMEIVKVDPKKTAVFFDLDDVLATYFGVAGSHEYKYLLIPLQARLNYSNFNKTYESVMKELEPELQKLTGDYPFDILMQPSSGTYKYLGIRPAYVPLAPARAIQSIQRMGAHISVMGHRDHDDERVVRFLKNNLQIDPTSYIAWNSNFEGKEMDAKLSKIRTKLDALPKTISTVVLVMAKIHNDATSREIVENLSKDHPTIKFHILSFDTPTEAQRDTALRSEMLNLIQDLKNGTIKKNPAWDLKQSPNYKAGYEFAKKNAKDLDPRRIMHSGMMYHNLAEMHEASINKNHDDFDGYYFAQYWADITEREGFNLDGVKFSESATPEVRASEDYRRGVVDGILSYYDSAIKDTAKFILAPGDEKYFENNVKEEVYTRLSMPKYRDAITDGGVLPEHP